MQRAGHPVTSITFSRDLWVRSGLVAIQVPSQRVAVIAMLYSNVANLPDGSQGEANQSFGNKS